MAVVALAVVFFCIGAAALIACVVMVVRRRRSTDGLSKGMIVPALVIMFTIAAMFIASGVLTLFHRTLVPIFPIYS